MQDCEHICGDVDKKEGEGGRVSSRCAADDHRMDATAFEWMFCELLSSHAPSGADATADCIAIEGMYRCRHVGGHEGRGDAFQRWAVGGPPSSPGLVAARRFVAGPTPERQPLVDWKQPLPTSLQGLGARGRQAQGSQVATGVRPPRWPTMS